MSYSPFDRNASGIVFFGTASTDQLFESNANFTIDGTSLRTINLKVANGGTIGSVSTPNAITIATDGDAAFSQDVSIGGNLTVNGTTTTVNSTVVTIVDPIITLGASGIDDNKDRGIVFDWNNGAAGKKGFFGFDDSTGKFTFVPDATVTSEVISGSAGTIVAAIEGNATTATTLATARAFSLTGEITASAVNFDGSAAVSLSTLLHESAITGQAELAETPAADDLFLTYDTSAAALKKVTRANLVAGLGGFTSFTASDGTNTQTITDGNTLTFATSARVSSVVSATDTVTHDLVSNSVSEVYLTTSVAGNGLAGGNGTALSVNVDNSTIEINADTLRVKDGGITEAKISRTVASVSSSITLSSDINLCTAGAGGITVTLPAVATGKIITVKKIDSAAGTVTVQRGGGAVIDGGTTTVLYFQYESVTLASNGTDWFII